jgi:hypothetical protein
VHQLFWGFFLQGFQDWRYLGTLLGQMLISPRDTFIKAKAVSFLTSKYPNISALNTAWYDSSPLSCGGDY